MRTEQDISELVEKLMEFFEKDTGLPYSKTLALQAIQKLYEARIYEVIRRRFSHLPDHDFFKFERAVREGPEHRPVPEPIKVEPVVEPEPEVLVTETKKQNGRRKKATES